MMTPGIVDISGCAPPVDDHAMNSEDTVVDMVNHPLHYTSHPSGVECIQITEHMGFCLGNAVKYLWRADLKQYPLQDLKKARWYIEREIARIKELAREDDRNLGL